MSSVICQPGPEHALNIIIASTLLVALAEIGDKTMLLAIILAARFRAPGQIIAGIFAATIVNHALAAWAGSAIAGLIDGYWFRLAVALGWLGKAGWILIPDGIAEGAAVARSRHGVRNVLHGEDVRFARLCDDDRSHVRTVTPGHLSATLLAHDTRTGCHVAVSGGVRSMADSAVG